MTMSDWILKRALPEAGARFGELVKELAETQKPRLALAEINDFLFGLTKRQLEIAVELGPDRTLDDFFANYLAAMVETVCAMNGVAVPAWTRHIKPLQKPRFNSDLAGLRLHLLLASPPPFRNRNIFIDASIGDRV